MIHCNSLALEPLHHPLFTFAHPSNNVANIPCANCQLERSFGLPTLATPLKYAQHDLFLSEDILESIYVRLELLPGSLFLNRGQFLSCFSRFETAGSPQAS